MTIVQAIILSIIEGITEFLPISSTGHLILASHVLRIPDSPFAKSFEIIIQLGAIMAVVTLYARKIMKEPKLIRPIIIAFLPTGILGLVLYKVIKTYLLGNDMVVVIALFTVGMLLIGLEYFWRRYPSQKTKTLATLTPRELLSIGIFQAFSMVPGVSRAAATIVGGMSMGLTRRDAVEFSFLLAVPTMAAATGLDLVKTGRTFSPPEVFLLAIGLGVSWITAVVVIRAFIRLITRTTFVGFGVYRMAVALLYLAMFL